MKIATISPQPLVFFVAFGKILLDIGMVKMAKRACLQRKHTENQRLASPE